MTSLHTIIPQEYIKQSEKLQKIFIKPEEYKDDDFFECYIFLVYGFEINIHKDEEDSDWYIVATDEDGSYAYEGWWKNSKDKSLNEAFWEAIKGSCIEIRLSIADVIDNAEMLFGVIADETCPWCGRNFIDKYDNINTCCKQNVIKIYLHRQKQILKMCQEDKSIEEISQYIIDNIK